MLFCVDDLDMREWNWVLSLCVGIYVIEELFVIWVDCDFCYDVSIGFCGVLVVVCCIWI